MIKRILILFFVLLAAGASWANGTVAPLAEFRKVFTQNDFYTNLDAQRFKVREGDLYKVTVRMPGAEVTGRYPIPAEHQQYAFWSATAKIAGLDTASGGVGLWGENSGLLFHVTPDGLATLSGVTGREVRWTQRAQILNFSLPADVTIERDPAGGVLAKVNGIHVLARITSPDLGDLPLEKMVDVGFVTRSPKNAAQSSAHYKELTVRGWSSAENKKND